MLLTGRLDSEFAAELILSQRREIHVYRSTTSSIRFRVAVVVLVDFTKVKQTAQESGAPCTIRIHIKSRISTDRINR